MIAERKGYPNQLDSLDLEPLLKVVMLTTTEPSRVNSYISLDALLCISSTYLTMMNNVSVTEEA